MTIFKPHEHRFYLRFLGFVFAFIILGGLIYILSYNSLVETKFELSSLRQTVFALEAQNADLKNSLYRVIEPELLEQQAKKNGLSLERSPKYLNSDKWLSDSFY